MENAATLAAVSSHAQDRDDRNSLRDQDMATEEYCKANGFNIVERLVSRESRSSKSPNPLFESDNTAYVRLIELCESRKIKHFVVDRDDRLARDSLWSEQVYRLCLNNSVAVHVVATGKITTSLDENPIDRQIKAISADQAAKNAAAATLRGKLDRNGRGLMASNRPYGYATEWSPDGTRVTIDVPKEQEGVRKFYELYLTKKGTRTAAKILRDQGYNITNGIAYRLVMNAWVYAGYVLFRRGEKKNQIRRIPVDKDPQVYKVKGQHNAVISEELAVEIEKEAIARSYNNALGKNAHTYSNMITCAGCEHKLAADAYYRKKTKEKISNYRCNQIECPHYRRSIAGFKIQTAVMAAIKSEINELILLDKEIDYEPFEDEMRKKEDEILRLQSELKKENAKLLNITRKFADDGNDEIFDIVRDEIENRKSQTQNAIEKIENELNEEPLPPLERVQTFELIAESFAQLNADQINRLIRDAIAIRVDLHSRNIVVSFP